MKILCNTVNSCSCRCGPLWSVLTPAGRLFFGSHDESAGESGVWAREILLHWSQNDTRANNSVWYQHVYRAEHVSCHWWWHQLNAGMTQETCPMQTSTEDIRTSMRGMAVGSIPLVVTVTHDEIIQCTALTSTKYTFFWWPSLTVAHKSWLNPTYLASIRISCMSAIKIVLYMYCQNITIDVSEGINPECDDNQANSHNYSRDTFRQCKNMNQDNLILEYINF